jgi:hypothetical protein
VGQKAKSVTENDISVTKNDINDILSIIDYCFYATLLYIALHDNGTSM